MRPDETFRGALKGLGENGLAMTNDVVGPPWGKPGHPHTRFGGMERQVAGTGTAVRKSDRLPRVDMPSFHRSPGGGNEYLPN